MYNNIWDGSFDFVVCVLSVIHSVRFASVWFGSFVSANVDANKRGARSHFARSLDVVYVSTHMIYVCCNVFSMRIPCNIHILKRADLHRSKKQQRYFYERKTVRSEPTLSLVIITILQIITILKIMQNVMANVCKMCNTKIDADFLK